MTEVLTTPPVVTPAAGWRFPARSEHTLGNGLRLLAYDLPGQYVVAASLLFDVPLAAEPRDLEGVSGLLGRTLLQGAGERSAEEFADALALAGADLDASAYADGFAIRLSAPATQLADAIALMADAAIRPSLSQQEFDNEKRLRLQEIEQAQAYPQHVAGERLNAALFGESRAGRPPGGEAETVEAVTRDVVAAYAEAHLQPTAATLIVAGDLSDLDVVALVESAFGQWGHSGVAPIAKVAPEVSRTSRILLVDWPDAPQATLRVATPAITRGDERWQPMFVANFAVGGNFSSRINTVLREEKGFTYGANSVVDTGRGAGVLVVSTAVRSDATAESVGDIIAIVRDGAGTLTDDEVTAGVRAASESAALGFERADAVVSRVELLVSQGLSLDHVDANLAAIRAVTTASANAAYGDIVDPAALTIVVVGDAATLREPLAALGYAEVEEL